MRVVPRKESYKLDLIPYIPAIYKDEGLCKQTQIDALLGMRSVSILTTVSANRHGSDG